MAANTKHPRRTLSEGQVGGLGAHLSKPGHLHSWSGAWGWGGGSLPSPGEPLVPGSPRGTAWSEDAEVNMEGLRTP